jgi:hypothetical protein
MEGAGLKAHEEAVDRPSVHRVSLEVSLDIHAIVLGVLGAVGIVVEGSDCILGNLGVPVPAHNIWEIR